MSKFIDKLVKLRQAEPQPMGFMLSKATVEKPKLQLVAAAVSEDLGKLSEELKSADAILIEVAKSDEAAALEEYCQSKDGVPGGAWLKAANGPALKKLLNAACDFVVFQCGAPISVTQKEKMGRILELDSTLSEGMLRTACDLPVDAVIAAGKESEIALTITRLMQIQRVLYMVNKPVLATIPDNITNADLQSLWDMGVSGVVVEVTDKKSAEKLADLRKEIDKLNPPAQKKKGKVSPILPQMQQGTPQAPEEGGEEDDE